MDYAQSLSYMKSIAISESLGKIIDMKIRLQTLWIERKGVIMLKCSYYV